MGPQEYSTYFQPESGVLGVVPLLALGEAGIPERGSQSAF